MDKPPDSPNQTPPDQRSPQPLTPSPNPRSTLDARRSKLPLLITAAILVIIPLAYLVTTQQKPQQLSQTTELNTLITRYNSTNPFARKPEINQLVTKAQERKTRLLKLAEEDPQQFLEQTLSERQINSAPQILKDQRLLETRQTLEGELTILISDDFANKTSRTDFYLTTTDGQKIKLNFTDIDQLPPGLLTGAQVTIAGTRLENSLVSSADQFNISESAPHPAPELSEHILVIFFNFETDPTEPMSPSEFEQVLISDPDSVRNFFIDNSNRKTFLSADVTNAYVTLPLNPNLTGCDIDTWTSYTDQQITQSGTDLSKYEHILYMYPSQSSCTFAGLGTLGGYPSRSWINGITSGYLDSVIAHELGHNFGLHHSSFIVCDQNNSIAPINSPACSSMEYGDEYSTMGSPEPIVQFNAPNKYYLGWLNLQDEVLTVTKSGIYTIAPLETTFPQTKLIRVRNTDNDKTYYLSYRQPIRSDSDLPPQATAGLHIRAWSDETYTRTYAVDATQNNGNSDRFAPTLVDGATFTDQLHNISITQLSHDANRVDIQINIDDDVCRHESPLAEFTPSVQTVSLTETANFNLNITNNDSPGCDPNQFNLTPNSADTYTITPNSFTLNPGESQSVAVTVTPHPTRSIGTFPIYIVIKSNTNSKYVEATLQIDGTLKSVSIDPPSLDISTSDPQQTLSAIVLDNNDNQLHKNVYYQWSVTPTSFGIINYTLNNYQAGFVPQATGSGTITVTATSPYTPNSLTASIPVTVTAGTPIPCDRADFNHDGKVDDVDRNMLFARFFTPPNSDFDISADGIIDVIDYSFFTTSYGYNSPNCTP